jgi:hypothetical protein
MLRRWVGLGEEVVSIIDKGWRRVGAKSKI